MIKLETLNPYTELARAEDIAKRAPDLAVLQGGGVLIESGEGTGAEFVVVPGQEMFEPVAANRDPENADRFESVFKGEDAITSALIRLRDVRKSKVGFITGHGESLISDLNPAGPGIGIWRSRLTSVGCETIELNLIKDAIPEDLSLLIIAGPKQPFKPDELAKLTAYAERGGPVLALVGNTEPSGLEPFLKSFNLEIGRGLVIDRRLNYGNNLQLVFAFLKGGPKHPITASLQSDRAVLVPNGAPIHIAGQTAPRGQTSAPVNANLVPSKILVTGPQSWAETDLKNPRARAGQGSRRARSHHRRRGRAGTSTPAGAAASESPPREGKPRLVLFSSRSLADNIVQGIEPTNLDLVMNAASWLRGRPDAVGIAPKTHVALTLAADSLLRVPPGLRAHGTGHSADHRRGSHRLRGSPRVIRQEKPWHPTFVPFHSLEPTMKTFRATFALIGLFFAGLLVLWWLDYTGVPTERERMLRQNRVLPELIDTPEAAIHRLEISHGGENLVFERRGPGRWQMRKPLDVAAEPGPLETLVRNLKDLRRSADSGAISGPAEPYGLAPPEATIRLWGDQTTGPASQERPLAALEIGKATTGYRYVRAAGSATRST